MFVLRSVALAAAAAALLPLARAAIVINPFVITPNTTNTITWQSTDQQNDPQIFSIELTNPAFNTQYALANNVDTTTGKISFQLPVVPVTDAYRVEFVNIGNINDVYAQSPPFAIAQHDASSPTPSASLTTPTTTSTVLPPSASIASTLTQSVSAVSTPLPSATPVSTPPTAASTGAIPTGSPLNKNGASAANAGSASLFLSVACALLFFAV